MIKNRASCTVVCNVAWHAGRQDLPAPVESHCIGFVSGSSFVHTRCGALHCGGTALIKHV